MLKLLSSAHLVSESYDNSHNRVKITPQGGVTIFEVNITPKRRLSFLPLSHCFRNCIYVEFLSMNLNLKMTVERSKRRSHFLSLVFITK